MYGTIKKIALCSLILVGTSAAIPRTAQASSIQQIKIEAHEYYVACWTAYSFNPSDTNRSLLLWSYYLRLSVYNDLPNGRIDPCSLRNSYYFMAFSSAGLGVRTEEALDVVEAIEQLYPCGPIG